jgi:hypothetical protein
MLILMLSGLGVLAFFAMVIILGAEADDKRRKLGKRVLPNTWK